MAPVNYEDGSYRRWGPIVLPYRSSGGGGGRRTRSGGRSWITAGTDAVIEEACRGNPSALNVFVGEGQDDAPPACLFVIVAVDGVPVPIGVGQASVSDPRLLASGLRGPVSPDRSGALRTGDDSSRFTRYASRSALI